MVAEKPSLALSIAKFLSNGSLQTKSGRYTPSCNNHLALWPIIVDLPPAIIKSPESSAFCCPLNVPQLTISNLRSGSCPIHEFEGTLKGERVKIKMTSVCGHVMSLDFTYVQKLTTLVF